MTMSKVHITGWRRGLNKIGMTKTIRAHLGFSLADAKRCTDQVLAGTEITLEAPNAEVARKLACGLEELGADATLESGVRP